MAEPRRQVIGLKLHASFVYTKMPPREWRKQSLTWHFKSSVANLLRLILSCWTIDSNGFHTYKAAFTRATFLRAIFW